MYSLNEKTTSQEGEVLFRLSVSIDQIVIGYGTLVTI